MIVYVFGPSASRDIAPAWDPAPVEKTFVAPEIAQVDDQGVHLSYRAIEPSTEQTPAESHAVYLPSPGADFGGVTPAELLNAGHPVSSYHAPVSVEGGTVFQEHPPTLKRGGYLIQTVLGYEVPDA